MKTVNQLKQERASLVKQQQKLVDTATEEKRELKDDETTEFRDRQVKIDAYKSLIEDAEAREANEALAAASTGMKVGEGEKKEKKKMVKRYSLHKALRSQLPNAQPLDGVEAEYHQEMVKEARTAGIEITGVAVPNGSQEKRAAGQTVTQDAGAYGANLVGTQQFDVIENLRPKPILESLGAHYMRGLTGNVEFPSNDGGIVATWEGEIDTVAATKNAYGKKTMTPNRLSTTTVVSLQNLRQSTPDLEALTANDIRLAMQQAIDLAGINGSGAGNVPEGILNATGTYAVVGGTNGAAPTWAHIVDMETGIFAANAEAARMGYLINPGTKGKLKTTVHAANASNYLMNAANEINGYQVGVSTLVPNDLTKGTAIGITNAAIFGNFADLIIGEWGFFEMVVDNITQKKSGNIELTVNQFIDMLIKHPKSFAVVKDWLV